MPPESLQWDRKEFYKERKNERAEQSSPPARWRETPRHRFRDVVRWESNDFRRPGHGKQGVWDLFHEESGHGFNRRWSEQKMFEEDRYKFPHSNFDGKYNRHGREIRGNSFCFNDSNANSPETSARALSTKSSINDKRPAVDMLMHPSHRHSNFTNTWEKTHTRKHIDAVGSFNDMDTRKGSDRDDQANTGDWGSLKWTRPGSLSSRGSGFSHSSTPRSGGVSNLNEAASIPKIIIPVHSASEEALPSTSSTSIVDVSSSRKRQRLGWGEGLAKYERNKEGINECSNTKSESCRSLSSNLADKSPEFVMECTSQSTPYSGPCSSPPARVDDKSFTRTSNLSSPGNLTGPPGYFIMGGRRINLDSLEQNSISSLSSSLMELLESEDINLLEHAFVGCTAMNKLLTWKESILNALEATESDIDKLESQLKSSKYDSVNVFSSTEPELSFHIQDEEKSQQLLSGRPPMHQNSCENIMTEDKKTRNNDEARISTLNSGVIDGPSTTKSEHVEPYTFGSKSRECCSDSNQSESKDINGNCFTLSTCSGSRMDDSSDSRLDADDVVHKLLECNKNIANESSGVFRKFLPSVTKMVDIPAKDKTNEEIVWRKLASRKQFLHFKERVITLKFRALLHMWNEDTVSLSTRKIRSKSHKKTDSNLRTHPSFSQKHPLSNRLGSFSPGMWVGSLINSVCVRVFEPALNPPLLIINFDLLSYYPPHAFFVKKAGNPSSPPPTPTDTTVEIVKALLSPPPPLRIYRDSLRMPALILDSNDRASSRFISHNSLVEDPCAVEKERAMINPWSSDEKKAFVDNFAIFGKNFRNIASFLPQKTTADCVEFYYKNHKSDCFHKKKKLVFRKHQDKSLPTSTYMVTSEKKKRNCEISSPGFSGCARPRRGGLLGGYGRFWEGDSAVDTMGSERETDAADALIGFCGVVSSEAAAASKSSFRSPRDFENGCSIGAGFPRNSAGSVDGEEGTATDWTDVEKHLFMQAVSTHGREFAKISQFVGTKSRDQCRIFFSKARKCLRLDSINRSPVDVSEEAEGSPNFPTTFKVRIINTASNSAAVTHMEEDQKTPFSTTKNSAEFEPDRIGESSNSSESRRGNRLVTGSPVFQGTPPATVEETGEVCVSAVANGGELCSATKSVPDRTRRGGCLKKCKSLKVVGGLSKMNMDRAWDSSDT